MTEPPGNYVTVDTQVRDHHRHHFEDEFEYTFDRLRRAHRLLTFISQAANDPYYTITPDALADTISSASSGVRFHNTIAQESGVLDVLDDHFDTLAAGIQPRHMPAEEVQTLTALGFPEIADHLTVIVYLTNTRAGQRRERRISQELAALTEELDAAQQEHRPPAEPQQPRPPVPPSHRKHRRWFKGLGQIVQGTAMSIADIALAAGTLHIPVSPETRSWGTIASTTAGVGLILGGVGDLHSE